MYFQHQKHVWDLVGVVSIICYVMEVQWLAFWNIMFMLKIYIKTGAGMAIPLASSTPDPNTGTGVRLPARPATVHAQRHSHSFIWICAWPYQRVDVSRMQQCWRVLSTSMKLFSLDQCIQSLMQASFSISPHRQVMGMQQQLAKEYSGLICIRFWDWRLTFHAVSVWGRACGSIHDALAPSSAWTCTSPFSNSIS